MANDYDPQKITEWIEKDVAAKVKSDVNKKAAKAARTVQNDMLAKITAATPVRHYSTHTQVVSEIILHRNVNNPKAVKKVKAAEYQPGYLKSGWKKGTLKTKRAGVEKIYDVYNEHNPTVPHLLNFDHDLYSHGNFVGVVHGTGFMDKISDEAQAQLNAELSTFLERK